MGAPAIGGGKAAVDDLIDREQFDGLMEAAGKDGVEMIMDAFWRSSDDLIATLARQIQTPAPKDAATTAHSLKGSAANVGAVALADAARELETLCKDDLKSDAAGALANVEARYAETKIAFTDALAAA